MTHGSLFSGIGGFDLAAEWCGWENVFHCEIDAWNRKVLNHYWPKSDSYADIKTTDFTKYRGSIDIISGGFPCQPYSVAGKRKGKDDDRHLWPEMLRVIREVQPTWVVGENVRGLVSWNGGMVFDEVQTDLEALGYEVLPFILPACAVNAPHRRDRVWFVAYTNNSRSKKPKLQHSDLFTGSIRDNKQTTQNPDNSGCVQRKFEQEGSTDGQQRNAGSRDCDRVCGEEVAGAAPNPSSDRREWTRQGAKVEKGLQPGSGSTGQLARGFERLCGNGAAPNTDSIERSEGRLPSNRSETAERYACSRDAFGYQPNTWQNFPTQSPICSGDDGLPVWLDGITFSKWRNNSIKAYGNAVVPQVVYQIFNAINQFNAATNLQRLHRTRY